MVEVLQGKRDNARSVEDKNLVTTVDTHSQLWTPSLQVNRKSAAVLAVQFRPVGIMEKKSSGPNASSGTAGIRLRLRGHGVLKQVDDDKGANDDGERKTGRAARPPRASCSLAPWPRWRRQAQRRGRGAAHAVARAAHSIAPHAHVQS